MEQSAAHIEQEPNESERAHSAARGATWPGRMDGDGSVVDEDGMWQHARLLTEETLCIECQNSTFLP